MSPLRPILRNLSRGAPLALGLGLLLSCAVLAAGVLLLGLSGGYLAAATGAGGLIGLGAVPLGLRVLALGRSALRYAERLTTHDTTLRGLARLRGRILAHLSRAPFAEMIRLRSADLLARMTSDIDALDGLAIRLLFPAVAGGLVLLGTGAALWALGAGVLALWVIGGAALLVAFGIWVSARRTAGPAARATGTLNQLRLRVIDHLRGRDLLASADQLSPRAAEILRLDRDLRADLHRVARAETLLGAALTLGLGLLSAGVLAIGGALVLRGALPPVMVAVAFFVTIALAELLAPLRRAMAELGKMRDAATRVAPYCAPLPPAPAPHPPVLADRLQIDQAVFAPLGGAATLAPICAELQPGQSLALCGPSGVGKSTVLNGLAGLLPLRAGTVHLGDHPLQALPEPALRSAIGYLPQRGQLWRGTVRESLSIAAPDASEGDMIAALTTAALWDELRSKEGLESSLGESGSGLSGGQRKRLLLARVLLRRPALLLLDEVTEGLDADTAQAVLTGLRRDLPQAMIVMAAHHPREIAFCDAQITLSAGQSPDC